ncbi:MAG: hypothetical protein Q8P50_18915 [Bacillota bacterium]|nr:hypothetical protein [Bacillota bacterium]
MKATVRTPKGTKPWTIFLLGTFTVLIGIWPLAIPFDKPMVVLGLPLLGLNAYIVVILTCFTLWLARRWGVH